MTWLERCIWRLAKCCIVSALPGSRGSGRVRGFFAPAGVRPSASSTLNFGVQSLQFRSGVVDFELPVDAALLGVSLVGPDPDLGLAQRQFADASVGQTLTA